jgi:hypothetical protein
MSRQAKKRKKSVQKPRARRGRPPTGQLPLISFRIPEELIEEVDYWSAARGYNRSAGLRALIEIGLNRTGRFQS